MGNKKHEVREATRNYHIFFQLVEARQSNELKGQRLRLKYWRRSMVSAEKHQQKHQWFAEQLFWDQGL